MTTDVRLRGIQKRGGGLGFNGGGGVAHLKQKVESNLPQTMEDRANVLLNINLLLDSIDRAGLFDEVILLFVEYVLHNERKFSSATVYVNKDRINTYSGKGHVNSLIPFGSISKAIFGGYRFGKPAAKVVDHLHANMRFMEQETAQLNAVLSQGGVNELAKQRLAHGLKVG